MTNHSVWRCILAGIALLAAVGTTHAASKFVANNGVDSGTCGGSGSPCRSIGQAITNALPGDYIRVGPGRYSTETEPVQPCDCLILIGKALKIEATEGAGGTVLDGGGMVDDVVLVDSDGVIFGLDHKGFTIVGGQFSGVYSVGHDDIEVHSHRVLDIPCGPGFILSGVDVLATYNEAHCNAGSGFEIPEDTCTGYSFTQKVPICEIDGVSEFAKQKCDKSASDQVQVKLLGNQANGNHEDGFFIGTGVVELESNLASRNTFDGFVSIGNGTKFKFNAATGNELKGFSSNGSGDNYDRNVSSGNGSYGIYLGGSGGHKFEQNAVLGNVGAGIVVDSDGNVLTKNNIFGNDTIGNCGVSNIGGGAVSAIKNYWGASSGPGANSADLACGPTVTTSPFLPGPTVVPYLTGSGGSP